jgi:general secretion pathway protein D
MMRKQILKSLTFSLFLVTLLSATQEKKRGILSHIPAETKKDSSSNAPVQPPNSKAQLTSKPKAPSVVAPGPLAGKKLQESRSIPTLKPTYPVQPVQESLKIKMSSLPTPPPVNPLTTPKKETSKKETVQDVEELREPEAAPQKSEEEKAAFEKAKHEVIEEQKVTFYFEDATLQNLVKYMEGLFDLTFLPDDAVNPVLQGNGVVKGHKISFKTNRSLTRQEAWDVFVRLLDISGLTLVPGATADVYRITSVTAANKDALPLYMGTDPEKLPNNAEKIRYVYFVKNSALATIQAIISSLVSTTAKVNSFADLDAIIITDKSINIKSLMKIIREFDESPPEAMSIIKLKTTDATTVAKLYQDLTLTQTTGSNRYFAQKKQPQSMYFPSDARIIPETRTNSLILIGRKAALKKIEDFIIKHIDIDLDIPYSPLNIYSLQHTSAEKITTLLEQVIAFGQGTIAQEGGVINGQKYFDRDVKIIPEPVGNNLIIKAEDDDYRKLKKIITELDVVQPQVAIEIMIVDITASNEKMLSAQLRNKTDGSLLTNINAQAAHAGSVVQNATTSSLLGDLVSLAQGGAGTTSLTIGNAATGVWGVFNALSKHTDIKVVSNPFLLTTNNYAASFTFGSTKQVQTSTVNSAPAYTPIKANLAITITPQININNEVAMDISIDITEFSGAGTDATAGNTSTKKIVSSASIKNQEVLALGGITRNKIDKTFSKTPILGDIPILGQLFKKTQKIYVRSNLLIFISPRVITAKSNESIDFYTQRKAGTIRERSLELTKHTKHDPIDKGFFEQSNDKFINSVDSFLDPDSFDNGYKKTQNKIKADRKKENMLANNQPKKKVRTRRTQNRRKKA